MQAVGICLQEGRGVMGPDNLVFVAGAGQDARDEDLPDARGAQIAHRVGATVPEVMVADDRDAAGGGRPDGERDARDPVQGAHVRTKLVMGTMVVALAQQEKVVLGKRREEPVGVFDETADSVGIGHAETITWEGGTGQFDLEDPGGMQLLHGDRLGGTFRHPFACAGPRKKRTGHQAAGG